METKKCKYCMTDIPKTAKVCPQCGRKQGGKLKIVGIVFAVLIVLGIIGGMGSDSDSDDAQTMNESVSADNVASETEKSDKKQEKKEEKEVSYTAYSVTELEDDLENNALAASEKYKDQYVELTGRLGTIDSDGKYISLLDPHDEWDLLGVSCYIKNDAQLDVVKTLAKDSTVVVKGKITSVGEVLGYSLDIDEILAQ